MRRATDLFDLSVVDIPERLTFLRMLRDRTVFSDHAVLKTIIGDYEQAQRVAWRREENPGRRASDKPAAVRKQAAGRAVTVLESTAPDALTVLVQTPDVTSGD